VNTEIRADAAGRDILGDAVEYLTPNLQITIEFFDARQWVLSCRQTVELKVMEPSLAWRQRNG